MHANELITLLQQHIKQYGNFRVFSTQGPPWEPYELKSIHQGQYGNNQHDDDTTEIILLNFQKIDGIIYG